MEDAILVGAARTGAILVLEELNEALLVYRQSLKNQRAREDDRFTFGRQGSEDIFENANNEVIFEHLHLESEGLEEVVRETMRSLEIDGNLDFLINNIAEQRAARIEEDAILGDAREKQAALAQLRHNIAGEQKRRKNEEERLKTELLRLRNYFHTILQDAQND
ncbi:PREDICTED: uncharacterized protein LOC105363861 [Ceratosolen solmsi marchali]|uniref:Uncharacterized protein LOC105363861 n=1 Tax=Ceratosolen solmsi marchali TaxID=326594 RepID=A0AAJ7DXF7_9HYME|nr:PREDICTED: uncharacterized protein LOC105363861 [Ceratosolen solmsi marchali]